MSLVSVGKFAFADQDYAINQDLTAIIPNEDVEPKYILYASFDLAETKQMSSLLTPHA